MKPLAARLGSPALRYRSPLRSADASGSTALRRIEPPRGEADNPATTTRQQRRRRLEAVLLLAREALPVRRLAQLANLADGTEARTLLRELQTTYSGRQSALVISQLAGGYRLLTRPALAPWIERFSGRDEAPPLSSPAAETLAVVAYRQPVLRAEVEAIRGAQSGELLRQLMHRGLLRIVGRSEELGRPLLYGTTKQFLQEYGLKNLDGLPPVADPLPAADAPPGVMADNAPAAA